MAYPGRIVIETLTASFALVFPFSIYEINLVPAFVQQYHVVISDLVFVEKESCLLQASDFDYYPVFCFTVYTELRPFN